MQRVNAQLNIVFTSIVIVIDVARVTTGAFVDFVPCVAKKTFMFHSILRLVGWICNTLDGSSSSSTSILIDPDYIASGEDCCRIQS